MSISDEVLMAYADGELDPKARAEVERAIAADPQIARRVAEHKALTDRVRSAYDPVLNEPVPDRLVSAARKQVTDRQGASVAGMAGDRSSPDRGVVVPLRPMRTKRPFPYWGAIAASFVVGALVWHFGSELRPGMPLVEHNGQFLASGGLDRALSSQLVKDQQPGSPVQIGVSFRSKSGSYCRTFQLRSDNNLAGLACRDQNRWRLEALAREEPAHGGQTEFRPAGSTLPPVIAAAVDGAIEGEALDAQAEAHARDNHWQQ